jgi:Fe-S-cluster containining protein
MSSVFYKINVNLTSVTSKEPIASVPCGSCTLCCQILSPHLTPEEVSSGKYPISLVQPSEDLLRQDPTIGPIVTVFMNKQGGCSLFVDNKCSIYSDRPLACRQFDCRRGHHSRTNARGHELSGI